MDTVQIAPGVFQFTATDDCTRMRVLALYSRRLANNAVRFLEDHVLKEFPFPIQRIQTDRGGEFFGTPFQRAMMEQKIKFSPTRPYSPHLNGKVERSQRTDRVEFYATVKYDDFEIKVKLKEWQNFYNEVQPHTSLGGKPPMARYLERRVEIPESKQIANSYRTSVEDYRSRDYSIDQQTKKRRLSLWYLHFK